MPPFAFAVSFKSGEAFVMFLAQTRSCKQAEIFFTPVVECSLLTQSAAHETQLEASSNISIQKEAIPANSLLPLTELSRDFKGKTETGITAC